MIGTVTMGADVGQQRDPTAIAVVEREDRPAAGERTEEHFLVRHLERLPLGTPYPQVAERIIAAGRGVKQLTGSTPWCFVDATGVGQPVVDVIRQAGYPGRLWPCYFTHGDRRSEEQGRITIGKAWLVSRLQALLQTRCLHLPRTAEADRLAQELLDYEIRIDERANDTYGAFKVGSHDDLVTALGLATQPVRRWVPL